MLNLAFCGNDCRCCPRYVATQAGDVERLKEAAALWRKVGWRETLVPPEEMTCHGCRSATWCRYQVKECAQARNVSHCAECKDYPCETIQEAFARTESYARSARQSCTNEEYAVLQEAFFSKKRRLDELRNR